MDGPQNIYQIYLKILDIINLANLFSRENLNFFFLMFFYVFNSLYKALFLEEDNIVYNLIMATTFQRS